MVAPAAGLSRSLRSLPLAPLGDSPAVRRDAPPRSNTGGGCRLPSQPPALDGRLVSAPSPPLLRRRARQHLPDHGQTPQDSPSHPQMTRSPGKPERSWSFRTLTRPVLTVTEPSNGFVRGARTHGRLGVGIAAGALRGRARPGRWWPRDRTRRLRSGRAERRRSRASAKPSAAEAAANRTPSVAASCWGSCEFPSGIPVIPGQRHVDPKA